MKQFIVPVAAFLASAATSIGVIVTSEQIALMLTSLATLVYTGWMVYQSNK